MGFLIGFRPFLILFFTLIFGVIAGCGSTDSHRRIPDGSGEPVTKTFGLENYDEKSTAPGHAYHADAFIVRTPMPARPDYKPWVHYYKHCDVNGDTSLRSQTGYGCTEPYY